MVEQPIWKDTYYTASTSALTYHINVDATTGNTIFNGKAYAMPNSSGVKVNISRNCADYLNSELASLDDGSYTNASASRTFYLLDNSNTLLETYVFSYDWSYEDNPQSITIILSSYSIQVIFIPICSSPPKGIILIFSFDTPLFAFKKLHLR